MKKRSATGFLIWVVVITLHAHLSIAAVSNSNETMSLCDGSLQDCPILHPLDSQFPTITARMLAEGNPVTGNTNNKYKQAIICKNYPQGYRYCPPLHPKLGNKIHENCQSDYKRNCPPS
ncbi:hypothetical protein LR48_Vigan03g015000 [Vigna angularis]|uniref:Uncharacterized protein n=2 Tax=Phaseolus angularis TaxID=3914 RepID=A0A0L9U2Y8_PHAAN|nr:hypothetical protein LR48_Vigan03g015000 [Vigna angularis]BAT83246.1 hypothetical protein VIGAN_04036400 [Vigna angularis var. angularis]